MVVLARERLRSIFLLSNDLSYATGMGVSALILSLASNRH